jgi:hypothetical protein
MTSALAFTKLLSAIVVRLWEFISPPTILYSLPILNHTTPHCSYSNTYMAITAATFENEEELYK